MIGVGHRGKLRALGGALLRPAGPTDPAGLLITAALGWAQPTQATQAALDWPCGRQARRSLLLQDAARYAGLSRQRPVAPGSGGRAEGAHWPFATRCRSAASVHPKRAVGTRSAHRPSSCGRPAADP